VDLLLSYDADPQSINSEGNTPLHLACFKRNARIVESLLAKGAYVNSQNSKKGDTPLHVAFNSGSDEIVEILILNGAKQDI